MRERAQFESNCSAKAPWAIGAAELWLKSGSAQWPGGGMVIVASGRLIHTQDGRRPAFWRTQGQWLPVPAFVACGVVSDGSRATHFCGKWAV